MELRTLLKINLFVVSIVTSIGCNHKSNLDTVWEPDILNISIPKKSIKTLKRKRREALEKGLLITDDESWVKANIYHSDTFKNKKIKIRLKGDWLDHLKGEKWSFRVKLTKNNKWKSFSTFSLQDPKTRFYLKEWVLHSWFEKEKILTTKYDFINLKVNDTLKGLYAFEEHFDKSILIRNNKDIGPIMKFTENGLWEMRSERLKMNIASGKDYEPQRMNTDIKAFKEKKILKSKKLTYFTKEAQSLMFDFMHGLKPLKEIFNLDLLAKYYAIIDITRGHHGVFWHNQRFYYNPNIKKLEPIGFDGYDETGKSWLSLPFLGFNLAREIHEEDILFSNIFSDWEFVKKYVYYLELFSEKTYLDKFVLDIDKELNFRKEYLKKLINDYQFDFKYLFENSKKIKLALKPNSSVIQTRTIDTNTLAICNRHCTAIEIVGLSSKKDEELQLLKNSLIIPCTKNTHLPDFSSRINIDAESKYLVYKILGNDRYYYSLINPWPIPEFSLTSDSLVSNLIINNPEYYYNEEKKYVVFSDSSSLKSSLVIPKNHNVLFLEGASINLLNGASIVTESPIKFLGKAEYPIIVYSSDSSSNGIIVYESSGKSNIDYTVFEGFSKNSSLSFVKSNFKISNSSFINSSAEDFIKVSDSEFSINNCTFNNSFSSGIYISFSQGDFESCNFNNIPNQCFNIECSNVTINNSNILNCNEGIVVKEFDDKVVPTIINFQNLNYENINELYLISKNTIINER
tara:strand:- start:730 stop:2955 length:2226 start_codon:yes stop_codon:yes gene_type:complete